ETWPNTVPGALFAGWVPWLWNYLAPILMAIVALFLLYRALLVVRRLRRFFHWRRLSFPLKWRVWPIVDETKQAAAGALMDALNVRFNPLFQPLPTSSFLAMPPALNSNLLSTQDGLLLRDFYANAQCDRPTQTGAYLSWFIEDLNIEEFSDHK